MLSNVRGDNNYFPEMRHSQAQTPKPEKKMPPLGNFAPPSVGKENKKRKGGAGSQVTGGAGVVDSGSVPAGQNSKNGNLRVGNTSKVSSTLNENDKSISPSRETPTQSVFLFTGMSLSWYGSLAIKYQI